MQELREYNLTKGDLCKIFDVNLKTLNKIIKEEQLNYIVHLGTKRSLYSQHEIENLLTKREELKAYYREHYYSYSEVIQWLEIRTAKKATTISIPSLVKKYYKKGDKITLYLKKDIDDIVIEVNEKKVIKEVELDIKNAFKFYEDICSRLEIYHPSNIPQTTKLWNEFVKQRLNKTNQKPGLKSYITRFTKIYRLLKERLEKEIFYYSDKELKLLFFSEKVYISYRRELYEFIRSVSYSLKQIGIEFKIDNIPNQWNIENNESETDANEDEIYSIEEWQMLFKYCNNVNLHKNRAIEDVLQFLNNSKTNCYDSSWLYVLMHLNNGWNHYTIVSSLPRIDISRTRITGINWFKNNNLSRSEAKDIILQIGRNEYIRNKTGKEIEFMLGEELELAFATAISICELRCRMSNTNSLIDFQNRKNQFYKNRQREFFKDFNNSDFQFSSLKLNKTVLTLIYSVLRENDKAIRASQFSRGHTNSETTNSYISLSRKQLDALTTQLFSRDIFGYIPKLLSDVLFEKPTIDIDIDREIETVQIEQINNLFGDKYKIEATSGFLNKVQQEKNKAITLIRNLSFEDARLFYRSLLLNQLPAKDKYYQCLYSAGGCTKPNEACISCEFSISNVYAITSMLENYSYILAKIGTEFNDASEGKKKRLANEFYTIRMKVKEATDTFGEETVYSFYEGGRKALQMHISGNREPKGLGSYITIKDVKNEK